MRNELILLFCGGAFGIGCFMMGSLFFHWVSKLVREWDDTEYIPKVRERKKIKNLLKRTESNVIDALPPEEIFDNQKEAEVKRQQELLR